MMARYENRPIKSRESQVFPTTTELEELFSELLATVERVHKCEDFSDRHVPLAHLQEEILSNLEELKGRAESLEEFCKRLSNRPAGTRYMVRTEGRSASSSSIEHFRDHFKVGSMARMLMPGTIESIDGDSVLMRYEMPGLSRGVS